jgi:hypothetical protein
MKHLQTYSIFESKTVLTEDQETFLSLFVESLENSKGMPGTWSVNPKTGLVDVNGNFECPQRGLKDFKGISFGHVSGAFDCDRNELVSLKGAPQLVRDFSCDRNDLVSLEGAPQFVRGGFYCNTNRLKNLKGGPVEVGGDFSCVGNDLKTLEGSPRTVGGDFYCYSNSTSLISLAGAPETIGGTFHCDWFELSNWGVPGLLETIKKVNPKAQKMILDLLTPEKIQQTIDREPEKMAVELKGVWKTLKADPKYAGLKFPEGIQGDAEMLSDLDDVGL